MILFYLLTFLLVIHVIRMVVIGLRQNVRDENTAQLRRLYKSQDKLNPYSYFQEIEPRNFWTYNTPALLCIFIQLVLFFLPLYLSFSLAGISAFGFILSTDTLLLMGFLLLPFLQILVYKLIVRRSQDEQSLCLELIYMSIVVAIAILVLFFLGIQIL